MVKATPLSPACFDAFFTYCRMYGRSIDESFLSDEDLTPENFSSGEEEPTYLLLTEEGLIVGAASLIFRGYQDEQTARFRIFHVQGHHYTGYQLLLDALLPHCCNLKTLHLFVPENHPKAREALETIGFKTMRYAWVLTRPAREVPDPSFPPGFSIRPLVWDVDVQTWCAIRNAAFSVLQGQGTLTPEKLKQFLHTTPSWEDSMLLLLDGPTPIGTVMVVEDALSEEGPSAEIGSLAILPEYQGRGLGRQLLRAALRVAAQHQLSSACLSVNAENEKATTLYLQEGFEKAQSMVCYQYTLKPS